MNEELVSKIIELFEDDELEIVEDGDWISEHKIDVCETIVKYEDKYYKITQCCSGSYYSDYEYYDPEVPEVIPITIQTIAWKPK